MGAQVCRLLKLVPGCVKISSFPNGEKWVQLQEFVEQTPVVLIKNLGNHLHDDLFELLLLIDAARRASAEKVVVVLPCYPYARQDHFTPGGALPPILFSRLLHQAGADALVTLDLHASQQCEAFALPTINLSVEDLWIKFLRQQDLTQAVLFAADKSMKNRVKRWADLLQCPWGYAEKVRQKDSGEVKIIQMQGPVEHRTVYLIDDRIDTGATLYRVSQKLRQRNAATVFGLATHKAGPQNNKRYPLQHVLEGLITTDTCPALPSYPLPIKTLSVASLLAQYLETLTAPPMGGKHHFAPTPLLREKETTTSKV